jgi:alpha-glucuronidase
MNDASGKTAKVTIGLWFDEKAGDIHLSIPDHGLSTVNADAASKRGHPHLFNKLAKVLRDQGKPHPAVVGDWDYGRGEHAI